MQVVIPLHWLSTGQALALLAVGAALLTALMGMQGRLQTHPLRRAMLSAAGLFIVASALAVLKDRTSGGVVGGSPHFMVLRNAETLTWAAIPLALALLQLRGGARVLTPLLGAIGIGLLGILIWSGVGAWAAPTEGPIRITVTRLPGSILLARDGNVQAARWLWFLGAVALALPGLRMILRRVRAQTGVHDADLGLTLLGCGISSMAMGIFFWHEFDWSDRQYAYCFMVLQALLAPVLVLGLARGLATARWAQLTLAALGAVLALWLLTGVGGGGFKDDDQELTGTWPSMLGLLLMLTILLLLSLQLGSRALVQALARRRRPAAALDRSI